MKFAPPLEVKLNDENSLFVRSAYFNVKGLPTAEVQVWNGTLQSADTLCLAIHSARARFSKSVARRVNVSADKVDEALLFISGNLTTILTDSQVAADDTGARPSQATQLIELAADAEFFHTKDGDAYATVKVGNHKETLQVKTKPFRRYLMRRFYEATKSSANNQAIQDAIGVLEGRALFDGAELPVFTRIAERESTIYLDLANDKWEAVEITSTGWQVVAELPVKFRRARGMLALPHPVRGGSINELRPFVNVASDADFVLQCAWLVQALRPRGPYPVGILHGEQGSAKSTTERVLRALIDPNSSPLRTEPRNEHDLMIAANNSWCVALDNMSGIAVWLSEALCRLSTGGGFSARELYTDADEVLFDAMRPILLNGIEEVATRGDLLDRAIIFYNPSIPEAKRRPESEFWAAFEQARPSILGALLDGVSAALRNLPNVHFDGLPRMADFALWATASEQAFGFEAGSFIKAYRENRESANDLVLDSALISPLVCEFAKERIKWSGIATKLLTELTKKASEEVKREKSFPKSPQALSNTLRRLSPNLRTVGVVVGFPSRKNKSRNITLEYICNPSSPSSPSSPGFDCKIELLKTKIL